MIKAIITDIEGTTTSISFVFDVLFPYARKHISQFIKTHSNDPEVRAILDDVIELASVENDIDSIIQQLIQWIDDDKKITPLKTLQGMIWKAGYESGDFKGHVYPDVEPKLSEWRQQGIELYVYSSGSVAAQKLIFGYSEAGDLTPLFSGYFDTKIGQKREANSYQNILDEIKQDADEVLFLSDIEQELDAAHQVGLKTIQLVRNGGTASASHISQKSFSEIQLTS